ncbi:MAG: MBL fold metallo-hydrolase [Candidatus Thorarchaeota archaeon]
MALPKIDNLEIKKITEDILLIHQVKHPFFFSCCDGLLILPKKERNKYLISLDLNIESKYVKLLNEVYGPISNYVCSHGHLDHICHIHAWEELGATVHAPFPESSFLLDFDNFYRGFGFNDELEFETVEHFGKLNGYHKCEQVNPFTPGITLKFEDFIVKTISFSGHSKGHVGFLLPKEKIFHISCLGFDKSNPETDGFGPWYGFKQCSLSQYREDIKNAEQIFLENAKFLTSSHSYIVHNPDLSPFKYLKKKIMVNQELVDTAINSKKLTTKSEKEIVDKLLEMDLFFPKKKLKGVVFDIYRFWESWIIRNHLKERRN